MKNKKSYFVSLSKETITRVSIPDADEYEIQVTNKELTELRRLMMTKDNRNFWFMMQNIVFDPLSSSDSKQSREQENKNLEQIYYFIYKHGTDETKEKLKSIGLYESS